MEALETKALEAERGNVTVRREAGAVLGAAGAVQLYGRAVAECVRPALRYLWGLATLGNLWLMITYLSAIKYTYSVMANKFKSNREKMARRQTAKNDLVEAIMELETRVRLRRRDVSERSAEVRLRTECFIKLRDRVRDLLAGGGGGEARDCLGQAWDDGVYAGGGGGGDDIKTVTEVLQNLNYERSVMPDKAKAELHAHAHYAPSQDDALQSTSSQSSGDARAGDAERPKVVKVTNIYKLGVRHRHVKVKHMEIRSLLKKKTEGIKKLLEEWHQSLSSVIDKKLAECKTTQDAPAVAANTEFDFYQHNYHNSSESDGEAIRAEEDNYYEQNWQHYAPYQPYYKLSDPRVFDMRVLEPLACECGGPQGSKVLFVLPEETNSQIAISEADDHIMQDNMCQ